MAVRKLRGSTYLDIDAKAALCDFLATLAPFTRYNYRHRFHAWLSFLGDLPFHEATKIDALNFISEVRKTPGIRSGLLPTEKQVRSYIVINHSIYKRAICPFYEEIRNPFEAVLAMKTRPRAEKPRRPTRRIPDGEVAAMEAIARAAMSRRGIMEAALFAAFCAGGLRLEEVQTLEIGQVRHLGDILYFNLPVTKSGEEQDRSVMQWGAPLLERYTAQRLSEGASLEDRLFIRYNAKDLPVTDRMNRSMIAREFERVQRAAGIRRFYSPHCARKTAISKLAEMGIPAVEIQKLSGHKHLASVERYILLSETVKNFKGLKVSFEK